MADNGAASTSAPAPADEVAKAARPSYVEIGSTGLVQSGGFVHEEFLPQLRGDRALKVFREMADNDPVVGAMLFAIDMLVRQVEWRVEAPEAASVEDIVAERQAERAKHIAAAQQAELQRQQQAQMAAQGLGGKGGPGMSPAKPKPADQVAKALERLGIDPDRLGVDLDAILKAEPTPNDPGAGKQRGSQSSRGAATGRGAPAPNSPTTPANPLLDIDPEQAAVIEGEEVAVFVETCLHDMAMPWEDTLSQILSMLTFGFAYHEIVYKKRGGNTGNPRTHSRYDDGRIGWRKLAPRAQETRHRWEFDVDGSVLGMWQFDPYARGGGGFAGAASPGRPAVAQGTRGLVFIPIEKALLFRTANTKGNPEGRSVLRNAYRPWYFKRRIEEIEAIGIERDLAGLPVAYVPHTMMSPNALAEERTSLAEIKKIVRNIKRDEQEGVVFPMAFDPESGKELYRLELLSTGGQRQFDTDKIIARYDQRIAMAVLADFILLGHEAVGSFALGTSKMDLFTAALEAWLDSIAETFNQFAIPRLLKLNGYDPALVPTLAHGRLAQVDLGALGDFILKLSQAGAPLFPDEGLEGYLRDVAGLPGQEGEEEL